MDRLRELLSLLKAQGLAEGHLLGLLHVLIGRRIYRPDGAPIAEGLTWREVAMLLKRVRWGPEAVQELGLDPKTLPPRDRERYWYTVISRARVDSAEAIQAGNRFARVLAAAGYQIAPPEL